MSEAYPGTQAVLRAITLLKAFSEEKPELNLSEIIAAADLKKTTAFRLLTALESEGLVERGQQPDTYRLGPEILALAGRALRSHDLRQACRNSLEKLAQETGETATLEIRVDDQVLIMDEAPGHHLLGTAPWLGTRWPLHATSTGKVMLAYMSQQERQVILKYPLPALTGRTLIVPERLAGELARIREQGFAVALEEVEAGFAAVAAPIFRLDGTVTAAISIGGPLLRLTPEVIQRIARLVVQQARAISYRLGYQPGNED
jgi:IclR family transcriptional regulator, acetate operon repressor